MRLHSLLYVSVLFASVVTQNSGQKNQSGKAYEEHPENGHQKCFNALQ
jgi:hypothetical protein